MTKQEKIKTRLIVSNGFLNMLTLFNTFSLRLSRIVKMMMMDLNKIHVFFVLTKFPNKILIKQMNSRKVFVKNIKNFGSYILLYFYKKLGIFTY